MHVKQGKSSLSSSTTLKKDLRNPTLERESHGCSAVVWHSILFLSMDVGRQIFSYAIKYHNNGVYPVRQTWIVALIETVKFGIFFLQAIAQGQATSIRLSKLFAIPAFIFTVNNNVYLFALRYTTPPIWNILIQLRLVTTPLAYRCVFKRYLSLNQWIGISIILFAVVMTNISLGHEKASIGSDGYEYLFVLISLLLTVVGSAVSTLMMEFQFKNSDQPFCVLQSQLYIFSVMGTWLLYGVECIQTSPSDLTSSGTSSSVAIYALVLCCILFSSASGITIALVSKKLDSIVKLYFQALSNILTSISCAILFPDQFQFSMNFIVCLAMMLLGVFVLESENIVRRREFSIQQHKKDTYSMNSGDGVLKSKTKLA